MSPIAAKNVARDGITLTPGTVIKRRILGPPQRGPGRSPRSTPRSHRRGTRPDANSHQAFRAPARAATRARPASAAPPTPNKSANPGWAIAAGTSTPPGPRSSRACAPAPTGRTARQPPAHRARALIGQPQRVQRPRRQQLRQRARIQAGRSSRAPAKSPSHSDSPPPPEPPAAQGSARSPPRCRSPPTPPDHPVPNSPRTLKRLRRRSDPARRPDRRLSTIATSQKSRCTSIPDAHSHTYPRRPRRAGEPVGKRHRRIRAHSTTRPVAGAATEKPELTAHQPQQRPAQPAFSQRAPVPVTRTYGRGPDSNPQRAVSSPKIVVSPVRVRVSPSLRTAC